MSKLLFQADDYGLSDSITYGIIKGIEQGVIRNTGLFVNMPSSIKAASFINDYPVVCFGIDINLVAGKPVSNPKDVPSLVDEKGYFITSSARIKQGKLIKGNALSSNFEVDPYDYDETLIEVENQVKRFIELVGCKPGYLHGHSLITPNIIKALSVVSSKYDVEISFKTWQDNKLFNVPCTWTPKPFPIEDQLATDVEEKLMAVIPTILDHEISAFICHAGFVEEDLFKYSTYTIIRQKDLKAATSDRLKKFIEDNSVELITYRDLKEKKNDYKI